VTGAACYVCRSYRVRDNWCRLHRRPHAPDFDCSDFKPRPERSRDRGGRYKKEIRCDGCGKPIKPDDYATDSEVCGAGDGPGFFLCHRKRCLAKLPAEATIEERRAFYTAQRERNRAAGG
jgi:hypothetical protein